MLLAAMMTLALASPQLRITPDRAFVGQELVLHANRAEVALPGTEIRVVLPDGSERAIGRTDTNGELVFVPEAPGQHVFRLDHDGLLMIAPRHVSSPRSPWLTAAVCVPLGLALLWRSLTSRGPRG